MWQQCSKKFNYEHIFDVIAADGLLHDTQI